MPTSVRYRSESRLTMGKCCRVAIADDAPDFREMLRVMLLAGTRDEFAIAGEATNAEEAVALAACERPDVLLLDLSMPGVSGCEREPRLDVIARIRDRAPATRVLVLSGFDALDQRDRALAAGASAYLTKGVPRGELLDAIRTSRASAERPISTT